MGSVKNKVHAQIHLSASATSSLHGSICLNLERSADRFSFTINTL